MGFHISQSITDAATILTIISFFMTLWVIRTTNFLKKKFKNKGRLPEIKTEISQTTNKIFSIFLNDFPTISLIFPKQAKINLFYIK